MFQRVKLRHKVTGEERGPYWGQWWVKLYVSGEYDCIGSSECYDKHANEIFEGDMVSYMDGWPVQIVHMTDRVAYFDRVGYFEDGEFVDVKPEWSAHAEIVGRDGVLFNW
jgi:hypothetical protein